MTASNSQLYSWAIKKASSPHSALWVGILFSLELVLFIPLDAILMFFCLENRKHIFFYTFIATIASVISGLTGYFLGHFLWDLIGPYVMPTFLSPTLFHRIEGHFQLYENWAVFLGALIPFPLKAITLTAGVFHLAFGPFFLCLIAARTLRFLVIGVSMFFWGVTVKSFIARHFHRILILIGAKIVMAFLFFWILAR